jgi:hypothetical protein
VPAIARSLSSMLAVIRYRFCHQGTTDGAYDAVMPRKGGGVATRLALTLIVAAGAPLLARITLPWVDVSGFRQLPSFDPTTFGIFAIELNPLLSAALLVEVLALLVPRWRAWRLGGYPERDRLWRRIGVVALVMATAQAFFMGRWLMGFEHLYPTFQATAWTPPSSLVFVARLVSLVGGTFLLFWLTRLVDSRGAGNGIAVILVAFMAVPTAAKLALSVRVGLANGQPILLAALATLVVVAAVTRLAGGRPLRPSAVPAGRDQLPVPSSGLQPLSASWSMLQLPAQVAVFAAIAPPSALAPGTWTCRAVQIALIAGLCTLIAWLFNRPRVVAEAWRRAGTPAPDAPPAADHVRAAFARSLAQSVVVCWGLAAVDWLCADAKLAVSVLDLTVMACVAVDVADEVRFRQGHGALARAWPVHRLYVLQGMLNALEAAGIPAFPRGRRYRTLWNFFAPYVPVDILVPAEQADRARAIVLPLSGSEVHSQVHETA